MYFSLAFILIFKIVIVGQSVAAIFINKTVPADLEDCAPKAEYKDKDGPEIYAAPKSGNIKIIGLLLSQEFEVDSGTRKVLLHWCIQLLRTMKVFFRCW